MEQQYLEEALMPNDNSLGGDKLRLDIQTYISDAEDEASHGFDCNICLDSVQDPVVTLCGHLFCWPCIYKWLHSKKLSAQQCQQVECRCPVCKAKVSRATLIPIYGKFQTTDASKAKAPPNLGPAIPRRPLGWHACEAETPASPTPQLHSHNYSPQSHSYYSQTQNEYISSSMLSSSSITTNIIHPVIGMFGDTIYPRTLGNTTTNLYSYPNSYGEWKRASSCTQTSLSPKEQISSVNGTTSIIKQPGWVGPIAEANDKYLGNLSAFYTIRRSTKVES